MIGSPGVLFPKVGLIDINEVIFIKSQELLIFNLDYLTTETGKVWSVLTPKSRLNDE